MTSNPNNYPVPTSTQHVDINDGLITQQEKDTSTIACATNENSQSDTQILHIDLNTQPKEKDSTTSSATTTVHCVGSFVCAL